MLDRPLGISILEILLAMIARRFLRLLLSGASATDGREVASPLVPCAYLLTQRRIFQPLFDDGFAGRSLCLRALFTGPIS